MKTTIYDPNANAPIAESLHWSAHATAQWKEAREMQRVIDLYFCE